MLSWYHTDEGDLPTAHRMPWTLEGSGATVTITADGLQIEQLTTALARHERLFDAGDAALPTPPARPGVSAELQIEKLQGSIASAGWGTASPVAFGIDDGLYRIGVAVGPSLNWIDPDTGAILGEIAPRFPWLRPNSFLLRKRWSSAWELYVNGELLAELPYLAAVDTAGAPARFFWGHLDASGTSTAVWEGVEAGVDLALPPAWKVERTRFTDYGLPIQRTWNSRIRALTRAIVGGAAQLQQALQAAFELTTAARLTQQAFSWTGQVLPSLEAGWSIVGAEGEIERQRWKLDGSAASYALTSFASTTREQAEFRARARFQARVLAGGGTRIGPYVEVRNGHRRVRAELIALDDDVTRLGWVLVEGTTDGPTTQVGGIVWRVDAWQPHLVEVQVLGRDRVLLIIDHHVVDDIPYSSLTDSVATLQARIGRLPFGFQPDPDNWPIGAYGRWNPYETADNDYTPGGTYLQLDDQTGQSHDMIVWGSAPDASLEVYPGKDGLTSLVQSNLSNRLRWRESVDLDLFSFTAVYAGGYFTPTSSTGSEYQINWGNVTGDLVALRQGATSRQLDFEAVGGFGPVISGVPANGDSVNAWLAYAFRCEFSGVSGETATWRLIVLGDLDDGNGVQLFGDETFTETSTTSGTPLVRRGKFRGVSNEGGNDKGVFSLWRSALSDADLVTALGTAVTQIGDDASSGANDILDGVAGEIELAIENGLAETRYADLRPRPIFVQTLAERLVFTAGCERNDWLDTINRHRFGLHALRGTQHGALRDLRRLSCNDDTQILLEESRTDWVLDVTHPEITPVFLDSTGTFSDVHFELFHQAPALTAERLAEIARFYIVPISTLELTYFIDLATTMDAAPALNGLVYDIEVDNAVGFNVDDVVTLRTTDNETSETATITAIVGSVIAVDDVVETYPIGSILKKNLQTT